MNGFKEIYFDMFKLFFVVVCWWYFDNVRDRRRVKTWLILLENYWADRNLLQMLPKLKLWFLEKEEG